MKQMIVQNINDVFTFGKYKGKMLKEVSLSDPSYFEWLCKDVEDFIIDDNLIDQLYQFCLSEFFKDPDSYLNEKGNFTLCSFQHLKFKGKELVLGQISANEQISMLKKDLSSNSKTHRETRFFRKVFNGDNCKKLLSSRMKRKEPDVNDYFEYNDFEDFKDQTDWSNYNDDLDMDQQSEEFWNQF